MSMSDELVFRIMGYMQGRWWRGYTRWSYVIKDVRNIFLRKKKCLGRVELGLTLPCFVWLNSMVLDPLSGNLSMILKYIKKTAAAEWAVPRLGLKIE